MSNILEKIESLTRAITFDNMWDVYTANILTKIQELKERMLALNPGMEMTAVEAAVAKYTTNPMTPKDCSNINEILGLPDVLHAGSDANFMKDFKKAYLAGKLSKDFLDSKLAEAKRRVGKALVVEAMRRVQGYAEYGDYGRVAGVAPKVMRIAAIQEFECTGKLPPMINYDKTEFSGDQVALATPSGYTEMPNMVVEMGFDQA